MQNWVVLRKGADFEKIAETFQISPRLACLIRNRDIVGDEEIDRYLNGTIADLYDGMLMKDMDKAVEILKEKITEGKKIRIIGDYDIDGVNATYILKEGLNGLKACTDIDIPDRMKDGYGLNKSLIDRAFDADVDTIVTCDNGIAAKEEIAYGKSLGMTIIVTDHHEVPYIENETGRNYQYPPADAVVDPKREDCNYPFKGLCGAAVAYKLVEALYGAFGRDPEDVDYLMEEVAIATVGDVMDLVGENRIFVKQGLEMLRQTNNRGLKALMECTGVQPERLSAYHIGFVIGPCINAGGRLDTAKRALELLEARTKKEADVLAGDLKALNDSRKELTEKAVKEALHKIETGGMQMDKVLVVYLPDCHESLAGIVAGRIRERYYKPAFVLTKGEEGVKGSGRSIEAYHMYEGLNKCSCLLTKFGGHKLAAGLSLLEENVGALRLMLNEQCGLSEEDIIEKVAIDMQLSFSCVTEAFIEELRCLEPFGKGNTKPVFAVKDVEVLEAQIVGKNKNVLRLRLRDSQGTMIDGVYFGEVEKLKHECLGRTMSFTYYPSINEYMGRKTPQITIQNYR